MRGDVVLEGSAWGISPALFASPIGAIVADNEDDVAPSIASAQAAAEAGNWVVGFVSYDAAPGLARRLEVPGRRPEPLVWFGVYESPSSWNRASHHSIEVDWEPSFSRSDHAAEVARIQERIRAGDTYQVNLTMAMTTELADAGPVALLGHMLEAQPRSFGALIDLGDAQVVSASPELFLRGDGRTVTMRPMKGTAPRGRSAIEDQQRRIQLETSEKERAGNVMIVDMLRNDLGRVSRTGSIAVPHLFEAERHPTVWQLTSTITADLDDGVGLLDLFLATFPSGSVTGAPKVSTMEIIARGEPVPRGIYCGAIGYIRPGGNQYEFSVAIRTGVLRDGFFRYHVGGGITADSDAGVEYDECMWKALVVTSERRVPDLMESMRYEPGAGIPLLEGHLRRLGASAEYWDIPLDPVAVGEALSGVESARPIRVRLILFRNGDVEIETEELTQSDEPVSLFIAPGRVDASEPHWFHKTLDRARYPESDEGEVLLANLDGEVTETNISNVMARFGDVWVTPPVDSGCLPGVYRQNLLDRGEVVERRIATDDLERADEIAVTNAVRGWRKAVLIG